MIAHDKTLLKNTFLVEGAEDLKAAGFINSEQFSQVKNQFTGLKTHSNLLVRIGFFILGCLLYSSISGAVSVFSMPILEKSYKVMPFVFAVIGIVGSELLSRNKYYAHGLDDAFVLGLQAMICLGVGLISESTLAVFIAMALTGLICCIRYVHSLSALVSLVGITGSISILVLEYHIVNQMFLPFVLLLLAVAIYVTQQRLVRNPNTYFYKHALRIMHGFSLLLAYASINYFVVREVSEELMNLVVAKNSDIPLAWLFYGLTFIIPVFYIAYSLKIKSRDMLVIGLLSLALSFATIRYYYTLMPIENALILGGTLLFVIAYFSIKKLRHRESGITFEPDRNADSNALLYAQAIIVNSQVNVKSEPVAQKMTFGGGGFSGGGSSESF